MPSDAEVTRQKSGLPSDTEAPAASASAAPIRALEFYSGIGAMHYSLMAACEGAHRAAEVLASFDLSPVANDVYAHNFGRRPVQGTLGAMTAAKLDRYAANMWLLSPPCQPFTRNGLRLEEEDPRSSSFLHLITLLPSLAHKPTYLLVENVVNFEKSQSRQLLVDTLAATGYTHQEFHLSPVSLRIPYSRPRYFLLAKLQPLCFASQCPADTIITAPPDLRPGLSIDSGGSPGGTNKSAEQEEKAGGENGQRRLEGPMHCAGCTPGSAECSIRSLSEFLEEGPAGRDSGLEHLGTEQEPAGAETGSRAGSREAAGGDSGGSNGSTAASEIEAAAAGTGGQRSVWEEYGVSPAVLERWWAAVDVVGPECQLCCCFTKGYYKFIKGTGSILQSHGWAGRKPKAPPALTAEESTAADVSGAGGGSSECGTRSDLSSHTQLPRFRYFTPREVANIHGFPAQFTFPEAVSLKQRYALLGNSMSCTVVTCLLSYMLIEL